MCPMKTTKLRWYKIEFNSSFNKIIESINRKSFNNENPIGFELIERSKSRVTARYIERQDISEKVQHPFGGVEEISSIKYIIFVFEIMYVDRGMAIIKILTPPKSLTRFVKLLVGICGQGFSISRIVFEIEEFYSAIINSRSVERFSVHKLCVSSLPFSPNTRAKFELVSSDNAYEELKKKYKHGQFKLDKIYLKARINGEFETIEISASGSALCSKGFDSLIENYIITKI